MKFIVSEMTCSHCKAAIENAVRDAGGSASVDLEKREVLIDGIDAARASDAIRKAGYSPQPA
ncbi:heavy-metal-associated domain-containing protein [Paracoccus aurantiacus]|uniref:Heavy-metal-associated domain-containing protein n=1 Tax=Paracoccus aurantiacus TaxID=2599412 RepID=A0A5C6S945_9RHOB|nr:heavy-metal-associated domain-containing protein [Paracoccus aurantiacus]TXB70894.1 heavy-metal-associated domain-containing protein [Paracoccus aurantiacus]